MRAFSKEVLRSITKSWGRFLAIAVMAALGCGFYAGLRMTGPDMRLAGEQYYDATNLCDVRVVGTLGLTDTEIDQVRAVDGVSGVCQLTSGRHLVGGRRAVHAALPLA